MMNFERTNILKKRNNMQGCKAINSSDFIVIVNQIIPITTKTKKIKKLKQCKRTSQTKI